MSDFTNAVAAQVFASEKSLLVWLKGHATPYHLTVAAVLGAATVGFVALIAVLILIATNFNALGFIE